MSYVEFEFTDDNARECYGGKPPLYATEFSAAVDLRTTETVAFKAGSDGELAQVGAGLKVGIPKGMAGLILPRSSLFQRTACTIPNSPGLIDSDYRGEVNILLMKHGPGAVTIPKGTRLAQFMLQYAPSMVWAEGSLQPTGRGEGGLGSTGHE